MRRWRPFTVVAVATAVAVAVIGPAAPGAAARSAPAAPAAPPAVVVPQSFAADSGDNCRYGATRGTLGWVFGAPPSYRVTVAVRGTVVDRPTPDDTRVCPGDRRYTIATFTAYAGRLEVDSDARRVDDGSLAFEFTLGLNSNLITIDRVVVQVCRISLLPGPYDYCGTPQEYRVPIHTTG